MNMAQPCASGVTSRKPRSTWDDPNAIIEINASRWVDIMASLHVRNLDDELVARLKRRAARHGRSAEAEHREILRQALAGELELSWDELAAELRRMTAGRKQTPSEVLLRESRDER
jgi:plasmid stability protein